MPQQQQQQQQQQPLQMADLARQQQQQQAPLPSINLPSQRAAFESVPQQQRQVVANDSEAVIPSQRPVFQAIPSDPREINQDESEMIIPPVRPVSGIAPAHGRVNEQLIGYDGYRQTYLDLRQPNAIGLDKKNTDYEELDQPVHQRQGHQQPQLKTKEPQQPAPVVAQQPAPVSMQQLANPKPAPVPQQPAPANTQQAAKPNPQKEPPPLRLGIPKLPDKYIPTWADLRREYDFMGTEIKMRVSNANDSVRQYQDMQNAGGGKAYGALVDAAKNVVDVSEKQKKVLAKLAAIPNHDQHNLNLTNDVLVDVLTQVKQANNRVQFAIRNLNSVKAQEKADEKAALARPQSPPPRQKSPPKTLALAPTQNVAAPNVVAQVYPSGQAPQPISVPKQPTLQREIYQRPQDQIAAIKQSQEEEKKADEVFQQKREEFKDRQDIIKHELPSLSAQELAAMQTQKNKEVRAARNQAVAERVQRERAERAAAREQQEQEKAAMKKAQEEARKAEEAKAEEARKVEEAKKAEELKAQKAAADAEALKQQKEQAEKERRARAWAKIQADEEAAQAEEEAEAARQAQLQAQQQQQQQAPVPVPQAPAPQVQPQRLRSPSPMQDAARGAAYVPQDFQPSPMLTLAQNYQLMQEQQERQRQAAFLKQQQEEAAAEAERQQQQFIYEQQQALLQIQQQQLEEQAAAEQYMMMLQQEQLRQQQAAEAAAAQAQFTSFLDKQKAEEQAKEKQRQLDLQLQQQADQLLAQQQAALVQAQAEEAKKEEEKKVEETKAEAERAEEEERKKQNDAYIAARNAKDKADIEQWKQEIAKAEEEKQTQLKKLADERAQQRAAQDKLAAQYAAANPPSVRDTLFSNPTQPKAPIFLKDLQAQVNVPLPMTSLVDIPKLPQVNLNDFIPKGNVPDPNPVQPRNLPPIQMKVDYWQDAADSLLPGGGEVINPDNVPSVAQVDKLDKKQQAALTKKYNLSEIPHVRQWQLEDIRRKEQEAVLNKDAMFIHDQKMKSIQKAKELAGKKWNQMNEDQRTETTAAILENSLNASLKSKPTLYDSFQEIGKDALTQSLRIGSGLPRRQIYIPDDPTNREERLASSMRLVTTYNQDENLRKYKQEVRDREEAETKFDQYLKASRAEAQFKKEAEETTRRLAKEAQKRAQAAKKQALANEFIDAAQAMDQEEKKQRELAALEESRSKIAEYKESVKNVKRLEKELEELDRSIYERQKALSNKPAFEVVPSDVPIDKPIPMKSLVERGLITYIMEEKKEEEKKPELTLEERGLIKVIPGPPVEEGPALPPLFNLRHLITYIPGAPVEEGPALPPGFATRHLIQWIPAENPPPQPVVGIGQNALEQKWIDALKADYDAKPDEEKARHEKETRDFIRKQKKEIAKANAKSKPAQAKVRQVGQKAAAQEEVKEEQPVEPNKLTFADQIFQYTAKRKLVDLAQPAIAAIQPNQVQQQQAAQPQPAVSMPPPALPGNIRTISQYNIPGPSQTQQAIDDREEERRRRMAASTQQIRSRK